MKKKKIEEKIFRKGDFNPKGVAKKGAYPCRMKYLYSLCRFI